MTCRSFIAALNMFFVISFLILPGSPLYSQSGSPEPIIINNTENMRVVKSDEDLFRYLNGDVSMFHAGTYFYCDTAVLKNNDLKAFGNVSIVQGDSVKIFGDTLYYNSDSLEARIVGKVLLLNNDRRLVTSELVYEVENKIARYNTGARMTQNDSRLSSRRGVYDVNSEIVYFYENVSVADPQFILKSDSLIFDSGLNKAIFIAPTYIDMDSASIYCEGGFYDIGNRNAEFDINPLYVKGKTRASSQKMLYAEEGNIYTLAGEAEYTDEDVFARADTIIRDENNRMTTLKGNAIYKSEKQSAQGELLIYNDETESFISVGRSKIVDGAMTIISDNTNYSGQTGKGYAKGNVEFIDTSSNMILHAAYLDFDNESDYMLTYGDSTIRIELIFYSDTDSTYMSADTLEVNSLIIEGDTIKYTRAWNNVRIYNKSYQTKADSMMHYHSDSLYVLFNDPVLWSEDTQISGDTISLWIKEEGLEKMLARQNGFIINFVQHELFNQIKGNKITAFFENDSLRNMNINGNAESIYHLEDNEKNLTATVKTVSSTIDFYFANNSIKDIKFHTDPQSILTPIVQEIRNPQRLDGFRWLQDVRPVDKFDIFPVKGFILPTNIVAGPDDPDSHEQGNDKTEPEGNGED